MSLSESKFHAILSTLRSDLKKTGEERRRSPRVGVSERAIVLLHSSKRKLNVFIRDLSAGGVGLTCEQAIAPGDYLSLLLTREGSKASHILYEVRHCCQARDGFYDVGARLVERPAVSA